MNRRSHASSLFLLELILAILFFSIASAVCVQLFIKAHLLSTDARALNVAVNECASAAEIISTSDSEQEALSLVQQAFPDASVSDDGSALDCFFGENLTPAEKESASYVLHVELLRSGRQLDADIGFLRLSDASSVYSLTLQHHLQRRIGE